MLLLTFSFHPLFVRVEQLDLYGAKLKCMPEVTVDFASEVETKMSKVYGNADPYVWEDANVFSFVVRTPPPYRVKIGIRDQEGSSEIEV